MNCLFNLFFFLIGLAVGSFLNLVIFRIRKREGFVFPSSYCFHCGHKLSWKDLVPVLSFVFLRGKCRYCKNSISFQYPLVELVTGIGFLAIFKYLTSNFLIVDFHFYLYLFYLLFCFSSLVVVFVYDLKHFIIPDKIVFPLIGISFLWNLYLYFYSGIVGKEELLLNIFAVLIPTFFFFFIWFFSKGKWLGFGDVKLVVFMGLFLGFPDIFTALFLASLIGAIIGIGLVALKKRKMDSEVPFGPFLVLGTLISFFFGENIVNWYLNLIL
jgi:leader peptidase (prepilin peptidase) / N-methyltransferase